MNNKYYQLSPDLTICRIVNGMWQVAGGHGQIDHELAMAAHGPRSFIGTALPAHHLLLESGHCGWAPSD